MKFRDGFFRLFFSFPLFPVEPFGSAQAHDRRNSPACDGMNRLCPYSNRQQRQSRD
jgi:hypothetical protein